MVLVYIGAAPIYTGTALPLGKHARIYTGLGKPAGKTVQPYILLCRVHTEIVLPGSPAAAVYTLLSWVYGFSAPGAYAASHVYRIAINLYAGVVRLYTLHRSSYKTHDGGPCGRAAVYRVGTESSTAAVPRSTVAGGLYICSRACNGQPVAVFHRRPVALLAAAVLPATGRAAAFRPPDCPGPSLGER